jgi:prepilin-type N-terminal cleavage/methylation domain-containing protein
MTLVPRCHGTPGVVTLPVNMKPEDPNPSVCHPVSRGFTLMETLVVISIIVVLAVLVFTLSSRAMNSAHKAVCVTNLRGVGNAIQICVSERNGILPGPLNTGQSALYNPIQARLPDKGRSLVNYIGPYMENTEDTDSELRLIANYGCPSLMKKVRENTIARPAILYRLEDRQNKLMDTSVPRPNDISYPWGYDPSAKPKRLDLISPQSASKVRMITEQNTTLGVGGWINGGSPVPAHGAQTMAMFWDFSVKAVNLTQL